MNSPFGNTLPDDDVEVDIKVIVNGRYSKTITERGKFQADAPIDEIVVWLQEVAKRAAPATQASLKAAGAERDLANTGVEEN